MADTLWTKEQEAAITLTGNNMLVSAAAGAGKTSVLVERIIRKVLSPRDPLDLERLLVVTFTEKAASEMKERIRSSLEAAVRKSPGDTRIERQLALLDRAQISTIHAFCLRVLRRYYFRVNLDPSFKVLDANEAELIRMEALEELFEDLYDDPSPYGDLFRSLVERFGGRAVDEGLQSTALRLHEFVRSQPSVTEFFQLAKKRASGHDLIWLTCLASRALQDIRRAKALVEEAKGFCVAPGGPHSYLKALDDDLLLFSGAEVLVDGLLREAKAAAGGEGGLTGVLREMAGAVASHLSAASFTRLSPARDCDPDLKSRASALRDLAKKAFGRVGDYAFTRPLDEVMSEMAEVAPFTAGLCDIVEDLDRRYTAKKRAKGGVDFGDLERYCLEILEMDGGRLAADVRREFDWVLIDEYQDTNPLQERILTLVSRKDEGPGNVFMVGDLKQSIYRFRLAEPGLILEKSRSYVPPGGVERESVPGIRIDLTHNFRSRVEVLDAVNAIFADIMREEVADIDYAQGHELRPGASYPPAAGEYTTELHLVERLAGTMPEASDCGDSEGRDPSPPDPSLAASDLEEYEALEKEALVAAARIRKMVDLRDPLWIWDQKTKTRRPCSYRDIAILMRSTKERANAVAEVLRRCDIPCYAEAATGYFQAREVEIALSLLSVIDNPLQDIPLAAVLRSPIAGLEPGDLAAIRASAKKGAFYDAVTSFCLSESAEPRLRDTLRRFLKDLDRWRTAARRRPLAEVLWNILRETGYHDYVGGLPGGGQRQANLRALCDRARQFDSFGHHGLPRFLRFIERLRESEGDLGTARALGEHEDVVRLMSIHKAKGLEFPVVFILDLGKRFNKDDLREDILFHRELGLGAVYVDLENRVKYPTALHQAIAARIDRENTAEEMRVLYVALTRAKEKLVMVGSARSIEKTLQRWQRSDPRGAGTYLDWICPVALGGGRADLFTVKVWGTPDGETVPPPSSSLSLPTDLNWDDVKNLAPPPPVDPEVSREVRRRLEWRYPLGFFTTVRAKMSVGELKRRLDGDDDDESWRFLPRPTGRMGMDDAEGYSTAVERGIAVHAFLARVRLEMTHSPEALAAENARLVKAGYLRPPGLDPADIARVAAFFASPAGVAIRESPGRVLRELPFTVKLPASVFAAGLRRPEGSAGEEAGESGADFIIAQGVIDMLLDEPDGLVILDFKTDDISGDEVSKRALAYTSQIALYALAAERILGKPVQKASIFFLGPLREVQVDWLSYKRSRGLA
ncbi:MAG: helicase-exonuclease AddAB subunit AddA [Bacillota bacterium]|nr:helicase-exonuclease AddAB subunit AddA [Candidatus Fermentithermobacillaceae bacterium]